MKTVHSISRGGSPIFRVKESLTDSGNLRKNKRKLQKNYGEKNLTNKQTQKTNGVGGIMKKEKWVPFLGCPKHCT